MNILALESGTVTLGYSCLESVTVTLGYPRLDSVTDTLGYTMSLSGLVFPFVLIHPSSSFYSLVRGVVLSELIGLQ